MNETSFKLSLDLILAWSVSSVGQTYYMRIPRNSKKGGLKTRNLEHRILKMGCFFNHSDVHKGHEFSDKMLQIIVKVNQ